MQSPEDPLHSHLRRPGIFLRNCLLQPGDLMIVMDSDNGRVLRRVPTASAPSKMCPPNRVRALWHWMRRHTGCS